GLLPTVIDTAALRENVASFAVCRMLVKLVKILVPMRNPTTKLRAKYAATPLTAQSRYFFESAVPATAAGKFLTVSKFESDSAGVPGFANASVSDRSRGYSGSEICVGSHASVGWAWSPADCGARVSRESIEIGGATTMQAPSSQDSLSAPDTALTLLGSAKFC